MTDYEGGTINRGQLHNLIERGDVDTVITTVCDMQGRLIGKRVTGSFFIEHCADAGTHFYTYLLATDMELNTPDGIPLASWASGYEVSAFLLAVAASIQRTVTQLNADPTPTVTAGGAAIP